MTLSEDQLNRIGNYVQANLPIRLRTLPPQSVQITDPVLLERIVHVEDGLKAHRELMIERFEAGDNRFEDMNRRFTHTQWLVGILVTVCMGLSTALQLM